MTALGCDTLSADSNSYQVLAATVAFDVLMSVLTHRHPGSVADVSLKEAESQAGMPRMRPVIIFGPQW